MDSTLYPRHRCPLTTPRLNCALFQRKRDTQFPPCKSSLPPRDCFYELCTRTHLASNLEPKCQRCGIQSNRRNGLTGAQWKAGAVGAPEIRGRCGD